MSDDEHADGDSTERTATTERALVRDVIREYDGYPAHRRGSEGEGDRGLLCVGFRDGGSTIGDDDVKELSWEEFFEEFDEKELALVYPASMAEDARDDIHLVSRENL
ncbi:hypothetical protein ACFQPA_18160 [Halomarina halobia]|uniref:Uncharacterized protein n=1 Tax=Halomarina halobia TaxID=3033386 RepID=A0ABD6AF66_9EURY|nr:hypothetical protein [Halomarina sp. PSR21]